jgi:hypothetical protein
MNKKKQKSNSKSELAVDNKSEQCYSYETVEHSVT